MRRSVTRSKPGKSTATRTGCYFVGLCCGNYCQEFPEVGEKKYFPYDIVLSKTSEKDVYEIKLQFHKYLKV